MYTAQQNVEHRSGCFTHFNTDFLHVSLSQVYSLLRC